MASIPLPGTGGTAIHELLLGRFVRISFPGPTVDTDFPLAWSTIVPVVLRTVVIASGLGGVLPVGVACWWATMNAATSGSASGRNRCSENLLLSPAVSLPIQQSQIILMQDNTNAQIAFRALNRVDLLAFGPESTRYILKGCTSVRELHQLILDCIALARPASLVTLIRKRLDNLLSRNLVTLPSSMLLE
ncbi:hypothetical protein C8F04DRAFT_1201026 [Mycena alexandri]|uniref:Uncharacterized protein n=1 Tax=Mycena alexandri TaxID=1745969 RepID=A0AAD6WMV2_9AGAR|nr:hypothetical protein C8F04DRAFT_1201026 [Mycena alexandri]